jgi:probable Rubsico expression protein CbbX
LIALILAWYDLSHAFFITITAFAAVLVTSGWLARNAWTQTREDDSPSAQVATRPRRERKSRAQARARRAEELHPEATVTLSEERETADIDDVFTALNNQLVGLVPVKKKVEEIASLLLVDRVRHRFGLEAPRPNLHMCFTGDPGTGKTTVALQMADLLSRLGYLEKGHLVHAMRDDLVGEFIGQTAPKTKRILERSMGGVLFIDEAYYLYRDGDSKDYGQECIDILLQVMENDRDKLVVILAGYKDRMDRFFESNPGMSSRIAHHLDFAPYKLDWSGPGSGTRTGSPPNPSGAAPGTTSCGWRPSTSWPARCSPWRSRRRPWGRRLPRLRSVPAAEISPCGAPRSPARRRLGPTPGRRPDRRCTGAAGSRRHPPAP